MTMSNLIPLTFAGDHGPFAPPGPLAPYRWVAPARPRRRFAYGAALAALVTATACTVAAVDTEGREAPRVPAPAVSAPPGPPTELDVHGIPVWWG
jgi:hypothetical protein